MIVNAILFAIVVILVVKKFDTGVIFIAITSVWLCMWRTPFMGSIYVISAFLAIVIAFAKYGTKMIAVYPFRYLFVLPFISLFATNIAKGFDLYPILKLSVEYLFPIVLYFILNSYKKLEKFLNILSVFLILLVVYTVYEEITISNPIMAWCENHGENFYWLTSKTIMRFGFRRAQSFLLFCSALGGICNFSFFILAYLKIKKSPLVKARKYTFLLYALPICTFLTGTRSVYIPFVIMSLAFIQVRYIRRHFSRFCIIVIFLSTIMAPYLGQIYDSIINSSDSEEVQGSSTDLRETQFAIASYYMKQSPVFGNGTHYVSVVREQDSKIMGAESIWLPLMIEQGILGCVCTALVFISMFFYLYRYKYYMLMWVMLAFVVGKTISVMGGIGEGFYFIVFVFLIRCHEMGAIPNEKTSV